MCGIIAILGEGNRQLADSMMASLVHRGPDAAGMASWPRATLGHRRLSIMDPEGGRQPLWNENESISLVANSEIYNYAAIKASVLTDHRFRTGSDSEVPLHLYEDLGCAMAGELEGMFAIILSDGESLFAARDPVGIKPLYHGKRGKRIVFASELKALAGHATDVKEFPPGNWFHSESGFVKYKTLPRAEPESHSHDYWCKEIRATIDKAVTKRLMSDVPLGAFLSGGLDSSIIAAVARQHVKQLHTFSVGLEGGSDLEAARIVARHIGSIHHEYTFTKEEVIQYLPEIIYHLESFDQDLVRSAVPCYFVSRLAAEHVKVILTGEGADELFAGYAYHKDVASKVSLREELYRSVSSLHNMNLQRVDRLTMAHSIEGRVPFLDISVIEFGQRVPPEIKIRTLPDGTRMEKWILRKAYEDLLPPEITWRVKAQFDEGTGTAEMLPNIIKHYLPNEKATDYSTAFSRDNIRSCEEAVYHKLLSDAYASDPDTIFNNVARWKENRVY